MKTNLLTTALILDGMNSWNERVRRSTSVGCVCMSDPFGNPLDLRVWCDDRGLFYQLSNPRTGNVHALSNVFDRELPTDPVEFDDTRDLFEYLRGQLRRIDRDTVDLVVLDEGATE